MRTVYRGASSWPLAGFRSCSRGISAWRERDSASCATDIPSRRYLRIHGNEETARQVLERHMETHEGTAYVIESRTRLVPVESLKLDPNRMFSRVGAEANLKLLNADAAPQQVDSSPACAGSRPREIGERAYSAAGRLTIALHNNGPGYSVTDEVPISDQTSLREPGNPHAFFLCTDPRDFEC